MKKHKYKILIVEDERAMLEVLKDKLNEEGFNILIARDGNEGIKLAIENHPDIILLDIIMPKSNGLNLLHSLRQDSWGKNVPVIIWSNVSDPQTRKHAEEHGIKTYLIKTDWSLNEAVGKIKEELESHATDKKTSLIKL